MKRNQIRESFKVQRVGKRWGITRLTKIGRVLEISVRLSTHNTRLDATIRLREMGVG